MRLIEGRNLPAPAAKTTRYFLGLDLGQSADYSALAILETRARPGAEARYDCRHLQRWPLRTSYPSIVADVGKIVTRGPLGASAQPPILAVDATGVGAPVVDLFRQGLRCRTGSELYIFDRENRVIRDGGPRPDVDLRAIQITGGADVTTEDGLTRVPKRDLVSVAQVALQTERLKIAATLPEAATLVRELESFQVKISLETAHDSYGAWREGAHDDLVLAVCLALWIAEHPRRRVMFAGGEGEEKPKAAAGLGGLPPL
jgi:hypothetical protein